MNFKNYIKIREEKFGDVIFDTLNEKVFITNATGKDILHLLEKAQTKEEIINALSGTYGVETENIRLDVVEFIKHLEENGIIERK